MAYAQVIYLCCLLLRSALALQLPSSPCPNVFVYEGDAESDRWHGVITFSSNIELVGMNYKVQLDRPSQLLVSWDGEVRTDDNTNYNVFDPFHTQRGGEVVKARIMVKFNPSNGIPTILRIVINGNTMCARDGNYGSGIGVGLSAESTTERYDPSFNEGDEVTSGLSNNRGQGQSSNNYGGNSPSYSSNNNNNGNNNNENNQNFETRPNSNRPSSYGNNEGSYSSGSPDLPNYNSNSNSNSNPNPNRPNYSNGGATNSPVYVVNPSNSGTNSNAGPYAPTNSNSHFNGNSNGYSGMGGGGGGGSFGNGDYVSNNRPQWSSDTSLANNYNNRTSGGGSGSNWQNQNQNNAFSNSPATTSAESNANGEPVVTTLTIPNANANKTNVDQIVQIIKNQLEQQQIAGGSNKTVIVAVVNSNSNSNSNSYSYSTPNSGSQISSSSSNSNNNNNNNNNISATTTDPSVVYRTTTVPTSTLSAKAKIVASTAKSSGSSNGHTSRP